MYHSDLPVIFKGWTGYLSLLSACHSDTTELSQALTLLNEAEFFGPEFQLGMRFTLLMRH